MQFSEFIIHGGNIYTPSELIENGYIYVSEGKIRGIGQGVPESINCELTIEAPNKFILPGFIDIHVNGGGGSLSVDGSIEAIRNIANAHAKYGTTSMTITTISVPEEKLLNTISSVREASTEVFENGAKILGIHLEGPFLNPQKGGAHNKKYLLKPSISKYEEYYKLSNGTIRILSLAPELDGAENLIKKAVNENVIVGLAHSDANYEETIIAISSGLKLCTHIFNAMPPLHHRKPGPIGAFVQSDDTYVEIISDGLHVHPAVMELVIKSKGVDKVILVTDAVNPAGTDIKKFEILGVELDVIGATCYIPGGGLAGSALTMNEAVKTIVNKTKYSLEDAIQMASLNPAKLLNIADNKGSIEVGKDADILIVDSDINVKTTIVEGKIVFNS